MLSSVLRSLLGQYNPWLLGRTTLCDGAGRFLPESYIARRSGSAVQDGLTVPDRAQLIVGPRQAGKSTLVWSLLRELDRAVLYLNCEELAIREWCRSPGLVLADLSELLPAGGVVFLEEAQWLEEGGLFVKGLIDARAGLSVVVTGSSSFHLLARTRESLAGRATYHRQWPLSLEEVTPNDASLPPIGQFHQRREGMRRMLTLGGYPAVWTGDDPAGELTRILTAYVLRDASDRFRIERPDAFRNLLALCAGQIGDLANFSEWGRVLGIATSTVADYCGLLEETHVLRLIRPFIGGKRAELTQAPKTFFIDNGLRNRLIGGFAPLDTRADLGKLLENWVFSELNKAFPEPGAVRYWRTRGGAEVDFVLEPVPGHLIGLEVKAAAAARPKLSRSARSFIETYAPNSFWVLHQGEPHSQQVGSVMVDYVPVHQLPDRLRTLPDPSAVNP